MLPHKQYNIPNIFIYLCGIHSLNSQDYRIAQNFDGGNIYKFSAIHQYFPYQNFPFS